MRRRTVALGLASLLALSVLLVAGVGMSYSDGYAGGSGAVPERFRDCVGVEFCKFKPSYCGTCHGQFDDMWRQEGADPTPQERVGIQFLLDGDDRAGTRDGVWEYQLGRTYQVDIRLEDRGPAPKREPGTWASGGFNLNASGGQLSKWHPDDPYVRITGGIYQHAGSKNPDLIYGTGQPYGGVEEDERMHAGEATHTARGSDQREWTVNWRAPATSQPPYGVAFVMTAMLPTGDGIDNCVYVNCNQTRGYAPQAQWDWFSFMIPRRIVCEAGWYDSYQECANAVHAFILPPSPPVDTGTGNGDEPRITPGPPTVPLVIALAALAWAFRRRDPRKPDALI